MPATLGSRFHVLWGIYRAHWSIILLVVEFLLDGLFIKTGPLHPIDYPTYLRQVNLITADHELDYAKIHGPTGPLVYPAGHVLIFTFFERVFGVNKTPDAAEFLGAQAVFVFVQLAVTKVVHRVYALASPTPEIDCLFFLGTVRARNIYVNGMFNDPFQVFFCLLGVAAILADKAASVALLCFSIGASIKMNALLWAPGVAYHYLALIGPRRTLLAARAGVLWQVVVGAPFLLAHPVSYVTRSFNLGRKFAWFNSVVYKWLPREAFYSSTFHATTMVLHLVFLAWTLFLARYTTQLLPAPGANRKPATRFQIAALLFVTHYTGFVFARSLHYSFYLWAFYTFPLLYHAAAIPWVLRPFVALVIELAWNGWIPYKGDILESCGSWKHALLMCVAQWSLLALLVRNLKKAGPGGLQPLRPSFLN